MKKLLLVPLVAALAACAGMDRDPSEHVQAVDAAQLGMSLDEVQWPARQWWHRYGDGQLNALVDEAVAGSPSIAMAQARLARAEAAAGTVRANGLPQVDATFTATRQRYTEHGIVPAPLAGAVRTDARLALNVGYDFDFWDKNGAQLHAALSEGRAAQAERQAAASLLAASVGTAYFNLQRLFAQGEVLRSAIDQRNGVVELTRQRYASGLDTQVEVKQAESALAEARTQLAQVDEGVALQRNALAALVGRGPERGVSLQPVKLAAPAAAVPDSVPLSLLGRRADIVAARWRVESARGSVDAAKAMFYPDVNLAGFIGTSALGLSNLFRSGSQIVGVGPAITLPIFEGGRLNANLTGRQADADLAIATYNQTVLHAVNEVADALASIRALERESAEQRKAREAIEQAYELAVKRYRAGLGNYLSVLAAQGSVLAQSRLDADLKARALTLDVALAKALGGGADLSASQPAPLAAGG
ncbi:Multidrug resistance outer membrane protein MdtP precursor [Pigmentiphaga humi]|uniref:Multidrug resistance outer membrane protein MdtP n=1 Tax=Pigmentiphaga humi TaxID=2478468 RepID=A0A3P4AZP0_9BURK|nr:efflux transporter outer membrane subunit [Pigmentiphaga humi]VCU68950.1 Multidrug resistance outer membrane protein MdtP precursor [Pigmentiphaga humi]